ncbi:MAG: hypothetical protein IJY84_02915 [Clostridia bacterium]|nr:hypothetical protein [Clostridia bacterium]
MNFATNVENFIAILNSENEWQNATTLIVSEPCKKALADFCLKKGSGFLLNKVFAIKKLIKALIGGGVIPPIKVKFDYFKKGHAYMLDKGEIHFCNDFLFKDAFEKNVAMTAHEIAHAILSFQPTYGRLLALNQEFLGLIKTPSQIVITPVEFYANLLTVKLLNLGVDGAKDSERVAFLNEEADFLKRKMRASIKEFNSQNS